MPPTTTLEDQFRSILGRDPNQSEMDYFTKFIKSGDLDVYEIGQILQSTPEYQSRSLQEQGTQYQNLLAQGDTDFLNRAQDTIRSDFYQSGRPSTSAYLGAYSNAARDLAAQRQSQLSEFYNQGFSGVRGQALSQGVGAQTRAYGLRDERRQRGYDIEDYYRQLNDYKTFLNARERRNQRTAIGQFAGGVLGAGIGGLAGKFGGARLGAQLGSTFGGIF